jgi:hypothetical protein
VLCTVIWEAYASGEREQVCTALEDLLPNDDPDWSRNGLYVYWDPESKDMLHVGLASNLPKRFAQHNGLVPHSGGNKRAQIDAWFETHEHLGFTIMIQAGAVALLDHLNQVSVTMGAKTKDIIAGAEGQLIQLHRLERGSWPAWNGVGGAVRGQEWAAEAGRSLIRVLTSETDSLFVARRSLRDLVADPAARRFEAAIHAGRMRAVLEAHEIGMPLPSKEDASRRILQLFMVRSGKLVDDLTPSHAQVIEWLRRIEDGRSLLEVAAMRDGLRAMAPDIRLPEDLPIARLLDQIAANAEEDNAHQASIVGEIFAGRYLNDRPRLPAP